MEHLDTTGDTLKTTPGSTLLLQGCMTTANTAPSDLVFASLF